MQKFETIFESKDLLNEIECAVFESILEYYKYCESDLSLRADSIVEEYSRDYGKKDISEVSEYIWKAEGLDKMSPSELEKWKNSTDKVSNVYYGLYEFITQI